MWLHYFLNHLHKRENSNKDLGTSWSGIETDSIDNIPVR